MGSGTSGTYQGTRGLQSARSRAEEMGSSLENVRPGTSSAAGRATSAPKTSSNSAAQNKLADSASQPDSLTTLERNALAMEGRFAMSEYGNFGKKSRGARIVECENPIEDSLSFYSQLGKGGTEQPLPGNIVGKMTTMPEGDKIVHRTVTKTPNSPAVEIKIAKQGKLNEQKIHFIRKA